MVSVRQFMFASFSYHMSGAVPTAACDHALCPVKLSASFEKMLAAVKNFLIGWMLQPKLSFKGKDSLGGRSDMSLTSQSSSIVSSCVIIFDGVESFYWNFWRAETF